MANKIVIENLISAIRGYIKILGNYSGLPKDTITADITIRGAVELNFWSPPNLWNGLASCLYWAWFYCRGHNCYSGQ